MVDSGAEKKCFPKKKAAAKPSATAATSNSHSLRFRLVVLHELMVVSLVSAHNEIIRPCAYLTISGQSKTPPCGGQSCMALPAEEA